MNYERATIDKCIRNGRGVKERKSIEIDLECFFDIDNIKFSKNEGLNTDDLILFNEIEDFVLNRCDDKTILIFYLISDGRTFQDVGRFFGYSHSWASRNYHELLDLVYEALNS